MVFCIKFKVFTSKYDDLKKTLKVVPVRDYEEQMVTKLNKNLSIQCLIYVLKTLMSQKKRNRSKRHSSLAGHIAFLNNGIKKIQFNGRKLLENRLLTLGCELVKVTGDGNCLFRSVASSIFENEKYHMYVRKRCVEHMTNFKKEYSEYFDDDYEFDEYLKNMLKDGFWGDELCIKAIADVFDCNVYIITSSYENSNLKYEPKENYNEKKKTIFLAFYSPMHYDYFKLIDEDIKVSVKA